jgi:diguanylate cyclase (GGDEF)-like protein
VSIAHPELGHADEQPSKTVLFFAMAFGGALCWVVAFIPGFMVAGTGPRALMIGVGTALWISGLAIRRYGLTLAWLFPVCLAADAATPLLTSVITTPNAPLASVSIFVLPTVLAAVYCSARQLAVQLTVATACAVLMLGYAHEPAILILNVLLCQLFANSSVAVGVLLFRRRLHASFEQQRLAALTDPLTGVLNRRGLAASLDGLVRAARSAEQGLAVAMLDVDHFKLVNDSLGHGVGDTVLRSLCQVLRHEIRTGDAIARLGGEEFVVVCVAPREELSEIATRLHARIGEELRHFPVTVSIGGVWTAIPAYEEDVGQEPFWHLIDEADELLYTAKRLGRDRVVLPPDHRIAPRTETETETVDAYSGHGAAEA